MAHERPPHTAARDADGHVDRAHYLAFAHTWAAAARMSGLESEKIEQRLIGYFRRLCRRIQPAVVLEIGAHEAAFSRWAAEQLPAARVMAFEANPHVHAKFEARLEKTRVDYRNVAVGPVTGEIELNVPLQIGGKARALTSRMASLAIHTRTEDQTQVTVPSVRLDDHVELAAAERVVAWVDVEGANDAVLQSGPDVLDRTDAIHIEVEWEPTWEGQWLDTDVALHLRRHGLVPVARDVKRRHQYNVVFVRAALVEDPRVTRQAAALLRRRRRGG